jgi:hypothetical protein
VEAATSGGDDAVKQLSHWRNPNWKYIPSTEHQDSTKFKERMEMRRKQIQKPKAPTTERKS